MLEVMVVMILVLVAAPSRRCSSSLSCPGSMARFCLDVTWVPHQAAGGNNLGTKIVKSLNLGHHHRQEGILKCLSILEIFFKKKFPIRK